MTRHDSVVAELGNARAILVRMLEADFDEAEIYRRQLALAVLTRHDRGCSIVVDRTRAEPGAFDERIRGDVLAERLASAYLEGGARLASAL